MALIIRPYKRIKELERICALKEEVIKNLKDSRMHKSCRVIQMKAHYEKQVRELKEKYSDELDDEYARREELDIQYDKEIATFLYRLLINSEVPPRDLYSIVGGLDTGGWIELDVVQELIPCDLYGTFSYEDNTGVFDSDDMDGYGMIHYYEIDRFSDCEYVTVGTMHEKMSRHSDPSKHPEYAEYREEVLKKTAMKIITRFPREAMNLLAKHDCFTVTVNKNT